MKWLRYLFEDIVEWVRGLKMEYVIAFAFGAFLTMMGYPLTTWQYWVAVALFFGYAALR